MTLTKMKIVSNEKVSGRYWHMVVDSTGLDQIIEPGQFFNIRCSEGTYPILRRPFSVYRINSKEKTLEFLYLVKGLGTTHMTLLAAGDYLDVFGPLGRPFTLRKEWDTILLLARGVGIATLAALAQKATEQNVNCFAILSARSENDLLAVENLQSYGASVYKVSDEKGTSDVESVRQLLKSIMENYSIKAAYTCGSKRLAKLLKEETVNYQIPGEIALEEHMGCAMGVCFACVCDLQEGDSIRTVRVCCEGPVFSLQKVIL